MSKITERSALRKQRIVSTRSHNHQEAEKWDLDFWQKQSPEERLSALVAIRKDVEMVMAEKARLKKAH